MAEKEFLISDIFPKELTEVFEKVKTNLEIIKQLSEETNELLKSIGAAEIVFQADLKCDHLFNAVSLNKDGYSRARCSKCNYQP